MNAYFLLVTCVSGACSHLQSKFILDSVQTGPTHDQRVMPVYTIFGYSTFNADSAFRHNMGSIQIWVIAMETIRARPPVGRPTKMESVNWRAFLVLHYLLKLHSVLRQQRSTRRLVYLHAELQQHRRIMLRTEPCYDKETCSQGKVLLPDIFCFFTAPWYFFSISNLILFWHWVHDTSSLSSPSCVEISYTTWIR